MEEKLGGDIVAENNSEQILFKKVVCFLCFGKMGEAQRGPIVVFIERVRVDHERLQILYDRDGAHEMFGVQEGACEEFYVSIFLSFERVKLIGHLEV